MSRARDDETSSPTRETRALPSRKLFSGASLQYGSSVFAIEFRDETCANFCRANGFALVGVGAIAKTLRVHLANHF